MVSCQNALPGITSLCSQSVSIRLWPLCLQCPWLSTGWLSTEGVVSALYPKSKHFHESQLRCLCICILLPTHALVLQKCMCMIFTYAKLYAHKRRPGRGQTLNVHFTNKSVFHLKKIIAHCGYARKQSLCVCKVWSLNLAKSLKFPVPLLRAKTEFFIRYSVSLVRLIFPTW